MKKKMNAMIAVVLCTAFAVPVLPVSADLVPMALPAPDPITQITSEKFSYDSEQALLSSEIMAGADYYFVTGFDDFVWGHPEIGEGYTAPGVYVSGVNEKGEIMGRCVLPANTVAEMNDVDFKKGDIFTFTYTNEEEEREWYANATKEELDKRKFDNYDDAIRYKMRETLGNATMLQDLGYLSGIYHTSGRTFHLKVTGNLIDTLGKDFEKICDAETALPRRANIHGHIHPFINNAYTEVSNILPNNGLRYTDEETANEWRKIYHIYPFDTPEHESEVDPDMIDKGILTDGRIYGVDCTGEYDNEQGCVHIVDLPGDANTDETVDIMDVVVTQKFMMGCRELTPEQKAAADVDQNGVVDGSDHLNILKYTIGSIESFDEVAAQ